MDLQDTVKEKENEIKKIKKDLEDAKERAAKEVSELKAVHSKNILDIKG